MTKQKPCYWMMWKVIGRPVWNEYMKYPADDGSNQRFSHSYVCISAECAEQHYKAKNKVHISLIIPTKNNAYTSQTLLLQCCAPKPFRSRSAITALFPSFVRTAFPQHWLNQYCLEKKHMGDQRLGRTIRRRTNTKTVQVCSTVDMKCLPLQCIAVLNMVLDWP